MINKNIAKNTYIHTYFSKLNLKCCSLNMMIDPWNQLKQNSIFFYNFLQYVAQNESMNDECNFKSFLYKYICTIIITIKATITKSGNS